MGTSPAKLRGTFILLQQATDCGGLPLTATATCHAPWSPG